VPVADFALLVARPSAAEPVTVPLDGVGIALATAGELTVTGESGAAVHLRPGGAALSTPDERTLRIEGHGQVFIAVPGR
jgi:mannose-6-phosphate isomerase